MTDTEALNRIWIKSSYFAKNYDVVGSSWMNKSNQFYNIEYVLASLYDQQVKRIETQKRTLTKTLIAKAELKYTIDQQAKRLQELEAYGIELEETNIDLADELEKVQAEKGAMWKRDCSKIAGLMAELELAESKQQ